MPTSASERESPLRTATQLVQQNLASGLHSWEAIATAASDFTATLWRQPQPAAWLASAPWDWLALMTRRQPPQWASPNEVSLQTPIASLRDFSVDCHDDTVVPTLVLPPQAGHSSTIVDFSPQQSQMATIRANGLTRAYAMEWHSATSATSGTTVEDYVAVIARAVAHIGGPVNLIGDCQGAGWPRSMRRCTPPTCTHSPWRARPSISTPITRRSP